MRRSLAIKALGRRKPKLSETDILIVFDGDSLTEGMNNAGVDQYYPKQVQSWLSTRAKTVEFYSYGVSGQTTQQMLSDVSTQIHTKVNNAKTNIIVAWEDVNAILNNGRTAQQNYDDFVTYFQGCKNAGFDYAILLTGYYPKIRLDGTYNNSAWETGSPSPLDRQHNYFEQVTAASGVPWNVHVDLRAAPNIGGARGETLSSTYFNDSVHLQAAGYDIVSDQVESAILEIFDL